MATKERAQALQQHWGRAVRQARGERSQAWLARSVGVDQTTISRVERGTHRLTADLMLSIAAALELEVEHLFAFPPGLLRRSRPSA